MVPNSNLDAILRRIFAITIQILWELNLTLIQFIIIRLQIKCCTWHHSYAVVPWAKFCSNHIDIILREVNQICIKSGLCVGNR